MKNQTMKTAGKYALSLAATIALTATGVYAWAGLTASSGDKLDYQKWNQLVNTVQSGIPTGAVMSFNLASCPSGWTEYSAAAGRTVIGRGNGAGSNASVGDMGWDKSKPSLSDANVTVSLGWVSITTVNNLSLNGSSWGNFWTNPTGTSLGTYAGAVRVYSDATPSIPMKSWSIWGTIDTSLAGAAIATIVWAGTAPDNMQPYIALLYCQKN